MNRNLGTKIVSSMILGTMCLYSLPVLANTKDETVYSKINNNGENYSTIVSEKLSNDDNSELIRDISELLEIENTNGDETFEQNGKEIIWKANGNKIQYQGKIEKEEPIKCEIKYELDGNEIDPKDIAGKSGKVKVSLNYTNNDEHTVKVNGKYQKMYTPFVVVAGTLIDNEKNTNIEITNGKILDNGNKTIAIGMCLPGLQESLDISKSDVNIPTNIEISMDASDFEMNDIFSYATPKLISEADLDMFDNLDDIYKDANDLQNASNKLVDGSKKLNDGAETLKNGTERLSNGTDSALNGAKTIKVSVAQSVNSMNREAKKEALDNATIESIGNSSSTKALNTIKKQENDIKDLAKKGADAGIDQESELIKGQMINAAKQIAETTAIQTAESTAKQVASDAAYKTALQMAGTSAYQSAIETAQTSAYQAALSTAKTTAEDTAVSTLASVYLKQAGYTDEQISSITSNKTAITKAISSLPKATQNQISGAKQAAGRAAQKSVESSISTIKAQAKASVEGRKDEIEANAKSKVEEQKEAIKAQAEKEAKLTDEQKQMIIKAADAGIDNRKEEIGEKAIESAKQIAEGTATETAYSTAQTIAIEVGNSVGKTVAGEVANTVKQSALTSVAKNMNKLVEGLGELTNGLETLNSGAAELNEGANTLKNGTEELSSGMNQFNQDGIKKITNLINGDVKNFDEKVKALKNLAKDYKSFAGIEDGDNGSVTFITTIDGIKKDDEQ